MARWRAVNSSCMGASVERPLAVAHGGHSSWREAVAKDRSAARADTTDSDRNDQLSMVFNENLNDQLSEKPERSAVGSHLLGKDNQEGQHLLEVGHTRFRHL